MNAPRDFVRRLEREHLGRLRIRWSKAWGRWEIEEKVGRAALAPFRLSEIDDSHIRARDGYAYVMSIMPGDRMACPRCHTTLKVPIMELKEIICDYCRFKGRDGGVYASYWPLGEKLLEHLWKISPYTGRDAKRAAQEADRENEARQAAIDKKTEAEGYDYLYQAALDQLPKIGYTGPTPMWDQGI